MKILSVEQVRALDQYTIRHEPVRSLDLMERAATTCADWILDTFDDADTFTVLAGPGNNGGDGLVIARLLDRAGKSCTVFYDPSARVSDDFRQNMERLATTGVLILELGDYDTYDTTGSIFIDAIFGSGLTRAVSGTWGGVIEKVNTESGVVISIDIPSGVFADSPTTGMAVEADFTLSLELPKLAFVIPENQDCVGEWVVLPIGLDKEFIRQSASVYQTLDLSGMQHILKPRRKFDHKGVYGHALLVAGSFGKVGAAVLAAKAALRSGAGLLTVHLPRQAAHILQIAVPEAMVSVDRHDYNFSGIDRLPEYSAIGMGCGLGLHGCTTEGIQDLLARNKAPMVIDADGLNTLSMNPDLVQQVPRNSILTPHLKEFARLFGPSEDHFKRLNLLRTKAMQYGLVIILKGAHTAIASPDGMVYFNTTGNPGMATAGSGDVLTGIVTGLLAQGYSSVDAACLGVLIHGIAGDIAALERGQESLIAGDIIENIGRAFNELWRF